MASVELKKYYQQMITTYQSTEEGMQCSRLVFSEDDLVLGDERLYHLVDLVNDQSSCQRVFSILEKVLEPMEIHPWQSIYKVLVIIHAMVLYGSDYAANKCVHLTRLVYPLQQYNVTLSKKSPISAGKTDYIERVRSTAMKLVELLKNDENIREARLKAGDRQKALVSVGQEVLQNCDPNEPLAADKEQNSLLSLDSSSKPLDLPRIDRTGSDDPHKVLKQPDSQKSSSGSIIVVVDSEDPSTISSTMQLDKEQTNASGLYPSNSKLDSNTKLTDISPSFDLDRLGLDDYPNKTQTYYTRHTSLPPHLRSTVLAANHHNLDDVNRVDSEDKYLQQFVEQYHSHNLSVGELTTSIDGKTLKKLPRANSWDVNKPEKEPLHWSYDQHRMQALLFEAGILHPSDIPTAPVEDSELSNGAMPPIPTLSKESSSQS